MSWLSSIFGGGSSNSSSQTTNKTTLTTNTTTVVETDELAKAMQSQADATAQSNQVELLKEKAKLNQNFTLFNELEGGIKKWALLGGFGFVIYKIMKKKR